MPRRSNVTELKKTMIEAMLLTGKVTCEICCDLDVPKSAVSAVRKKLIEKGKGNLWHTSNYLVDKGWA